MKSLFTVVVVFFGLAACHPQLNPGRCNSTSDCPTGQTCDLTQNGVCVCSSPGCADGGGTGGAATGGTGGGAANGGVGGTTDGGGKDSSDASHGCQSRSDCSASTPACSSTGACVQCNVSTVVMDCLDSTKPICDPGTNTCVACTSDDQCVQRNGADPGVCMAHVDGHCAMPAETIYVKNDTSVCVGSASAGDPGAGSVTKPLCTMDTVSTLLSPDRSLVLVRGTVQGATSWIFNGKGYDKQSDVSLSVVGQSVPHIAGGASPALNMSAGTAYVRGLELSSGGTGAAVGFTGGILQLDAVTVDRSADGVDISGGSLSIKSSTISGGSAIGIKATGGSLNVDKSYVESNMTGGILINGATYTIQNTVLAANGGTTTGYGIEVDMAPSGSQFWFNTVVNNPVAATCASTNPPSLGESIVIGPVVNCVVSDSVTTSPGFDSGRPYHLTAHLACPAVPTSSPDHDIDGDPRSAPLDCGADQFVK